MSVAAIPPGYHSVTPYLVVKGARAALDFYAKAFGAKTTLVLDMPDGSIGHAEIQIGNSMVMLGEENPAYGAVSPTTLGGNGTSLMVYLSDVDKAFARALAAGAVEVRPLADQFYGDRTGTCVDPFGHQWTLATHVEDVPPEEIARRVAKLYGA
ncbi:MAG: VOC family protein [Planctomycetaceae bacterium]|nr:VOC family protein [Planctomycetaceae bacterium]